MDDAAEGTTLAVTFTDGSELSSAPVVIARGHPDRPLATSDIEDLCRASADRALVLAAQARPALKMLANLESVTDVGTSSRCSKATARAERNARRRPGTLARCCSEHPRSERLNVSCC
ncbi:MAG TPA: hypothetical protein VHZ03_12435 [Trebonia sp.]|jgi:hypothetical protein|nr:hypothetical protein [Trebonia sp.]